MRIVRKEEAVRFESSDKRVAFEYELGDKDINGAYIEISGRYPEENRVVNEVCKEIVFVINGSGKVVVEGTEILLKQGDQVLIEPGEKFYFDGHLSIFEPCSPAWYPEQYKEVE